MPPNCRRIVMYRNAVSESLNRGHTRACSSFSYPVYGHIWIVLYYFQLSSIALLLGSKLQGYGWLLAYPGVSCFLLAAAYWSNRTVFLRKRNGRFTLSSWIVFAPYLVGIWCSWRLHCSRTEGWTEVVPGILLGRRLLRSEARQLLSTGDFAVLDLAPEIAETRALVTDSRYLHLPVLDRMAPSAQELDEAVRFIRIERKKRRVFVHCSLGLSRGSMAVAAYLVQGGMQSKDALALIRGLFPESVIRTEMKRVLKVYERSITRCSSPAN